MTIYYNYVLVVGRMCGDDEDSARLYEHCTEEEAVLEFKDDLWAIETEHDTDNAKAIREAADLCGEGVFVNHVFASASPIEEI
jgi:hypothetical protein